MEKHIENVKRLHDEMDGLLCAWNGKDRKFSHEGSIYDEDDVHMAEDICQLTTKLLEVMK